MSSLIEKVQNFKEDHPLLHKIVMVAGVGCRNCTVVYLMAGEANAKIQSPDNPKKDYDWGQEDVWRVVGPRELRLYSSKYRRQRSSQYGNGLCTDDK